MRSEYALVSPHPGPADRTTVTRPHQIGLVFTGHRQLVYTLGGRSVTGDVAAGAATVSGEAEVRWLRVHELAEAMEIYPDPALLVASSALASRPVSIEPVVGAPDATVLGIGSVLRRVHVTGTWLGDVAASTLAHRLVDHLLDRYADVRMPAVARVGVLDSRTVDRVAEFVEAHLHDVLTLDDLAAVAHLSTYHFARVFSRSTGLAPHRFVTSRRMDRARLMLWATDSSVEEVARAVGFSGAGHFRRVYRRFHGVTPAALRAASPSGARTARIDLAQTERPPPG